MAYIKNSGNSYGLNADQIIYLRQQGVSDAVITAMLNQPKPGSPRRRFPCRPRPRHNQWLRRPTRNRRNRMSEPRRRRITITSRITIRSIATITVPGRWFYPTVGADTGMAVGTVAAGMVVGVAVGLVADGTAADLLEAGMVVRRAEFGTAAGLLEAGTAAGTAEIILQLSLYRQSATRQRLEIFRGRCAQPTRLIVNATRKTL